MLTDFLDSPLAVLKRTIVILSSVFSWLDERRGGRGMGVWVVGTGACGRRITDSIVHYFGPYLVLLNGTQPNA